MLGVLFSAPLVCKEPRTGELRAIDTLDFETEKQLICLSMHEAQRNLRLRFEHATNPFIMVLREFPDWIDKTLQSLGIN